MICNTNDFASNTLWAEQKKCISSNILRVIFAFEWSETKDELAFVKKVVDACQSNASKILSRLSAALFQSTVGYRLNQHRVSIQIEADESLLCVHINRNRAVNTLCRTDFRNLANWRQLGVLCKPFFFCSFINDIDYIGNDGSIFYSFAVSTTHFVDSNENKRFGFRLRKFQIR